MVVSCLTQHAGRDVERMSHSEHAPFALFSASGRNVPQVSQKPDRDGPPGRPGLRLRATKSEGSVGVGTDPHGNNLGRHPTRLQWRDGSDPRGAPMLPCRSLYYRHSVSTVLAHPMQHLGAVKLPALTVHVVMPATAEAETQYSEKDGHNTPVGY
jgi:hypothetical protein